MESCSPALVLERPSRLRNLPIVAAILAACGTCHAAPEEIQVYLDDMSAPGQFGVDVHNNYVTSGSNRPEYPGQIPPLHVYRLTPEFYYGLSQSVELGLYVLTSREPDGEIHVDGSKARVKFIAPHDEKSGMFWGANLEIGRTRLTVSETPWNGELKGIFGYRAGPWTLAVDPNLDWAFSNASESAALSLDVKVNHSLVEKTDVGVELYNELGALRHFNVSNHGASTVYAVIDQDLGAFDLNIGVGRGFGGEADRWTAKFILGTHF